MTNASTPTKLLKGGAAVQTSDCRKHLDLPPEADGRPACKRCAQVEDLLHQVAELQEAVRRLCNIRETEELADSKHCLQWTHSQELPHWHI